MAAIEVQDLKKKFNGFIAVDKISFSVEEGELFALLGPNGVEDYDNKNIDYFAKPLLRLCKSFRL